VSDSDGKGTPVYSVCQAKGNSNNQYYAFLLREMARSGFIQSLYRGIRERSSDFRFEVFASQFYPVPPRDEQDQIVRFLDWKVSVINHLINVKHREIKAIDEIKRSMISNAVTHGINFDTPMKYSGIKWLGVIPIHWKLIRGKNLYEKLQRPVKNTDDVVTCFRDGTVTLRKNRRTTGFTESLKEIGYQGIQKGDLVIHVMDAFAGSIGVSDSDGKGTPVYSICQAKTDSNNYYYAFLLREMARTGFIQSLYRGIRERSSDFRFEVFGKQFYPAPPRAEQDEIVDYLGKRTEEIEKYITIRKLQIAELEDLRRCLISDVVTGKIDVRGIEIPDYEFIAEESPDDADASEDEMGSEVEEN
jgi:type I restriction enzyme S subunit